jgi:hypothetical protein
MFGGIWHYYAPDAVEAAVDEIDRLLARGYGFDKALELGVEAYRARAGRPPKYLSEHIAAQWRRRRRLQAGKSEI